jgi:hypothetical protein
MDGLFYKFHSSAPICSKVRDKKALKYSVFTSKLMVLKEKTAFFKTAKKCV